MVDLDNKQPSAAVIEIIERGHATGPGVAGVIAPDDVRINGQSLLTSAEHPVIVHQINTGQRDIVVVTLTLLARRVTIGAELDPPAL